jgi:alanine racemase
LSHNVGVVRRLAGGPAAPRVMAVVKADAYGLGAVPVARHVLASGCSSLAVNDVAEAAELRDAGIAAPMLVLGASSLDDVSELVARDVAVALHSDELIASLDAEARGQGRFLRVHLKIDTGLTRLGARLEQALDIACAVAERPHLVMEGAFTHLSSTGVARAQLDPFEHALAELDHAGLRPPVVHAANSAALFAVPAARYDLVRPGIALFGMDPGLFSSMGLDLRPALALQTHIAHLRAVPAGATVGYDQTWTAPRDTVIATCPVGYDDGYPWALGNRGSVLVRGVRAPVVGRVSMNFMTVDVGDVPEAAVSDEVTLVGRDGAAEIRVEELARLAGTIPYELTCRLGRRIRREYVLRGSQSSVVSPQSRVAV